MAKGNDCLPPVYFYFFWLVEPILALSGAAYAIFRPEVYGDDLLPHDVESFTAHIGSTVRGQMLIGCLGSCFLVLALVSLSLFPIFKRQAPALQERLVVGLLVPLAVADVTHIFLSLWPLPGGLALHPQRWTQLIHGNVTITAGLFLMRMLYILGVGRETPASLGAARAAPEEEVVVAGIHTPRRSTRTRKAVRKVE